MKILINDFFETKESYIHIFQSFGYESNEIILCSAFSKTKEFIEGQLSKNKNHVDLIITNQSVDSPNGDVLGGNELCYLKNSISDSYSKGN